MPCHNCASCVKLQCSARKIPAAKCQIPREVLSFPNLDLFSFSSPSGGSPERCRLSRAAVPLAGLRFLCSWVALLSRSLGDSGRAHPAPAPYPSAQSPQPAHRREGQAGGGSAVPAPHRAAAACPAECCLSVFRADLRRMGSVKRRSAFWSCCMCDELTPAHAG